MLPEQPRVRRTDERRTWSSQAWVGPNPYFLATRSEGKALKSHMPSSVSRVVGKVAAGTGTTGGGAAAAMSGHRDCCEGGTVPEQASASNKGRAREIRKVRMTGDLPSPPERGERDVS